MYLKRSDSMNNNFIILRLNVSLVIPDLPRRQFGDEQPAPVLQLLYPVKPEPEHFLSNSNRISLLIAHPKTFNFFLLPFIAPPILFARTPPNTLFGGSAWVEKKYARRTGLFTVNLTAAIP